MDGHHFLFVDRPVFRSTNVARYRAVFEVVRADVSDEIIRDIQLVIRKAAHVLEYAILAILSCRALAKHTTPLPWAVLGQAVLIASAYAVLDEWHQSWTAERFGSPLDVAIDSVGATVGAAFFAWLSRRKTGTTSP